MEGENAMIRPRRIGHATFETPDLEKAIAYYGEFMGLIVAERDKERAFLATKIGQLVIQLNKADRAHCIKLSFEVAPDSDFGELARELSKDGVRSELRNDSVPGMGQVLSFKDDKGTTAPGPCRDRKSTRLNSSHSQISYAGFCLKKKNALK